MYIKYNVCCVCICVCMCVCVRVCVCTQTPGQTCAHTYTLCVYIFQVPKEQYRGQHNTHACVFDLNIMIFWHILTRPYKLQYGLKKFCSSQLIHSSNV